jgi:hypothetical protein
MVFENKVLRRKIFGIVKVKGTGKWRKAHNEVRVTE